MSGARRGDATPRALACKRRLLQPQTRTPHCSRAQTISGGVGGTVEYFCRSASEAYWPAQHAQLGETRRLKGPIRGVPAGAGAGGGRGSEAEASAGRRRNHVSSIRTLYILRVVYTYSPSEWHRARIPPRIPSDPPLSRQIWQPRHACWASLFERPTWASDGRVRIVTVRAVQARTRMAPSTHAAEPNDETTTYVITSYVELLRVCVRTASWHLIL